MKKLIYVLLPLTFLIVFFSTYNLGEQYMWSDEIFSFHAAERILETGEPTYESGLEYGRSTIYHYLLAYFMKLFGVNEFGSRVLNIPFALGTWLLISLFSYTLLKKIKSVNKRVLISYSVGLLYFVSNFSIAMLRETRMYTMNTFLLLTAIYLIYKGVVETRKGIYLKWLDLKIDLRYVFTAIPVLLIALETQPINLILGVGLILFFTLSSVFYKNWRYLLVSVLLLIFAILMVYVEYDTLNMLIVFDSLSPDWALDSSPLYYSVLTVRNFPFVILTSVISIYFLFKKGNIHILFLSSLILGFLSFLSFQDAQHERYWQAVIPLIFILSGYSLYLLFKNINEKRLKYIFIGLISIFFIFHMYLSVKEITEIETYTPHSLSIHKKLEFREVSKYVRENDTENTIVVGDFHSVYTLQKEGIQIDYLLLTDTDVNWEWGARDIYFDIPLINQLGLRIMSSTTDGYLVVRDENRFGEISFEKKNGFERPVIYEF